MLTPEQINEMLEAAKPSIIEGLKKEISQNVTWEIKQKAAEIVAKETTKWINENIIPELIAYLVESKNGLLQIGAKLAPRMVEELTKMLIDGFKKKLESSYERGLIIKSLFG